MSLHQVHHARAHALAEWQMLHAQRSQLQNRRTGLIIRKGGPLAFCTRFLKLLHDIARAKFDALQWLVKLDALEKKLHGRGASRRILLGHPEEPVPSSIEATGKRRHKNVSETILAFWLLRRLMQPRMGS
jgi:hypothetical protein